MPAHWLSGANGDLRNLCGDGAAAENDHAKSDGGELKQCAIAEGMETLRQDGWRRVAQGTTTIEEVVRVTQTDEVMAETSAEAEPVVAG